MDVYHIINCVSLDMQCLFVYFIFCGFLAISGEKGRKALLREIELLKLFGREGHENVVKFIGCVTVGGNCYDYNQLIHSNDKNISEVNHWYHYFYQYC